MTITPDYTIGTQFKPRGKQYICTIVDIWKTYDSRGSLQKTAYIATHQFLGQTVTGEYNRTNVAMGIANFKGEL